ncbi:MAG: hypothetical protein RIE59_04575 [Imperialibacter sp.]
MAVKTKLASVSSVGMEKHFDGVGREDYNVPNAPFLDKTWMIYAVIAGFVIRIPAIRGKLIAFQKERRISKS